MGYTRQFTVSFKNVEDNQVTATITDLSSFVADIDTSVYDLRSIAGNYPESPIVISVIDNDEDKYTPIRALQAKVKFFSSNLASLYTFLGVDQNWFCDITCDGEQVFYGFLVTEDNQMEFQADPNIVTLTFTDNLATLKDIELSDFDNEKLIGMFKLKDYIAYCLKKTGLSLNFNIVYNLYGKSYNKRSQDSINCPFNQTYLDDRTFEKQYNEHENCYQVLTTLLEGMGCELYQSEGEWWIERVAERTRNSRKYTKYDSDGNALGGHSDTRLGIEIGFNYDLKFINQDANLKPALAKRLVSNEFPLRTPLELIRNSGFIRGDLNGVIDAGVYTPYDLDDWVLKQRTNGVGSVESTSAEFSAFICRSFNGSYEKERFIQLTIPTNPGVRYIRNNEPLYVDAEDKISVSVDFKWLENKANPGTYNQPILTVELYGTTNRYTLDNDGKWFASSAPGAVVVGTWLPDETDETKWQSVSVESEPMPERGTLYVWLHAANRDGSTTFDNVKMCYSNLNVTYIPFINGAYQQYKGIRNTVTNPENYKIKREGTVEISNSPKRHFRGALMYKQGSDYFLSEVWQDDEITGLGPETFGKWRVFDEYNQYRQDGFHIEGTIQGLAGTPDLSKRYLLRDASAFTQNKWFKLLHFEQDLYLCEWRGYFAEVYDVTKGLNWDDDYLFKWIT
jgi:hypothetical protein